MITGYLRPQTLIQEVLQQLPNVDALSLHAFVFGPQFDLFRYYVPAERANMKGVPFVYNASGNILNQQLVPFEGIKAYHIPDATFVKLYGENLEGGLWDVSSGSLSTPTSANPYTFQIPSLSTPNQILVSVIGANITVHKSTIAGSTQLDNTTAVTVNYGGSGYAPNSNIWVPIIDPSGNGTGAVVLLVTQSDGTVPLGTGAFAKVISPGIGYQNSITYQVPGSNSSSNVGVDDSTLLAPLQGRPIQAGDVVYTTVNGSTVRRLVTGVIQQTQPTSLGVNGTGQFAAAASNPIRQDTFSFGNTAAPFGWNLNLAASSILAINVAPGGAGSGYSASPAITISAPNVVNPVTTDNTNAGIAPWTSVQATAVAVMAGDVGSQTVASVQVTEPGTGYFNNGVTAITVGSRGTAGMYSLTNPPIVQISAPNDTVNGIQATAIAHISPGGVSLPSAGELLAIEVINPGAGYTSTPTVTILTGTATATATVAAPPTATPTDNATLAVVVQSIASNWNGLVQGSIYQNKYGERYTLTVTNAGTTNALFRIRSSSGGFTADNVSATVRGNIYTITDASLGGLAVQLQSTTGGGLSLGQQFSFVVLGKYMPLVTAPTGQVIAVNIIAGGSGHSVSDPLTFSAPPAGGVAPVAVVASVSGGAITGITIVNPGSGYQYAPLVTIGTGTGAIFQAVISTATTGTDIALTPGSTYNGPVNNRYIVTVVEGDTVGGSNSFGGAVVRVQDTAGIDNSTLLTVVQGVTYNLGSYGLQFMFPNNQVTPSGVYPGITATGTLTVSGGGITGVTITNGGYGYSVPPVITLNSIGTGAVLQAVLNNGVIEAIVVVGGVPGYSGSDTITIAAPTAYQSGLRTGDSYYLDVVAAQPAGAYNTIVLGGQVADITGWAPTDVNVNLLNIKLRTLYTGQIVPQGDPADAPNYQWTVAAGGISVKNSLKINVPSRNTGYQWVKVFNSPYARLYASWRGLVPSTGTFAANGVPTRYYSTAAIQAAFGVNDQDNPMGYGATIAFNGGQGKSIFAASVATNDVAGYTALLAQASKIQGPYSLAPLTLDPAVFAVVQTHVDSASTEEKKLWRRAYVSTTSPGKYAVYQEDANGNSLQAQVLTNGSGNVRVVAPNATFIAEEVQPGDLYRTYFLQDAWGNLSYQEFPIQAVLEDSELILATGPTSPITPAIRFEIWRPDTSNSQCVYAGNISEGLDDRRVVNVWVDNPTVLNSAGQYVVTPTYYVAAEIAGLRAALLPQQGLTYTQILKSVTAAPTMYTKYADADLDIAAANGVMIVTQDLSGGPMYIRHQLTTDTGEGSLYYEDSVGTNFDNIAYTFKAILQPYIGQRNATPQVVEELDVRTRTTLDQFKSGPTNLSLIGPAIIDYGSVFVSIDATFRDRINMGATVILPLPLNVVTMTLTGTTITGNVSITTTITQQPNT